MVQEMMLFFSFFFTKRFCYQKETFSFLAPVLDRGHLLPGIEDEVPVFL